LNLSQGYFAPRSSQPSIPPGSVNEYQLRLGRQRQVWLIPLADETQGVQVKLCYPLTMRAIPERLIRRFVWRRYTNRLPLPFYLLINVFVCLPNATTASDLKKLQLAFFVVQCWAQSAERDHGQEGRVRRRRRRCC